MKSEEKGKKSIKERGGDLYGDNRMVNGKLASAKSRGTNFTRTGTKLRKLNLQDAESALSLERN